MAELDLYDVTVRGHLTQMKLTGTDAAAFGDQAKKVGAVKPAEPQPVQRPPWSADVDESGALVTSDRKKAPPAQNKARTTS